MSELQTPELQTSKLQMPELQMPKLQMSKLHMFISLLFGYFLSHNGIKMLQLLT